MIRQLLIAAMTMLAYPGDAHAQSAPSPADPSNTIVVTGSARDEAQIRARARSFVTRIEAAPIDGQVARWNAPICPKVEGVEPAVRAIVAARIRAVARNAGVRVAEDKCRANILVSFTSDAKTLVATLERRESTLFADSTPSERVILRDATTPIRWWYTTLTEGSDGRQLGSESPALALQGIDVSTAGRARTLSSYSSSLIDTKFRVSLNSVMVLIDANRATGHRLDAIVDYVAFVALARIRVGAPIDETPSIMRLFADGPDISGELSQWDKAYLAALYAAPANRSASTQRRQIVGKIVDKVGN